MPPLPLASQSYESAAPDAVNQRLINIFAEPAPQEAGIPFYLRCFPGLSTFASMGLGPIRGARQMGSLLYVVSGSQFFSVDSSGTVTTITGNIAGQGPVTMEINTAQTELAIAAQPNLYTYSTGSGLALVTDADLPSVSSLAFLDGFAIVSKVNSSQFNASDANSFSSWDALQFANAESDSDFLLRVFVEKRELLLMGERTVERWYNAGASPFPFARLPAPPADKGINNKDAVTAIDNTIFWFANDGTMRRLEGPIPRRISTHAVETAIRQYADKTCTAGSFIMDGHNFVVFGFASATWCYNINTQGWFQLKSNGIDNWRVEQIFGAFGKTYGGDRTTGSVYEITFNALDEADTKRPTIFTLPAIGPGEFDAKIAELRMNFQTGVGLTTGQGSDPQVIMRFSTNGGRTWSNERRQSLGKLGEYEQEVRWNRLGAFERLVVEFSISDPVVKKVVAAYAR